MSGMHAIERTTPEARKEARSSRVLAHERPHPRHSPLLRSSDHGCEFEGEAPPIVHEVLASPGQPLDPSTRSFMESRFGHDFSQVRIHTDSKAVESARAINARAYTVGEGIVFNAGVYAPNEAGRMTLSHELAHVVQQRGGGDMPARMQISSSLRYRQMSAIDPVAAEREAGEASQRVAIGQTAPVLHPVAARTVQLQREQQTDEDEKTYVAFLERGWFATGSKAVLGDVQWPLFREVIRGFVGETRRQIAQGKVQKFWVRLNRMWHSLLDTGKLAGGYLVGILEGIWDSIKGIVDLLLLVPRLLYRSVKWLITDLSSSIRNWESMSGQAQALLTRLDDVEKKAAAAIKYAVMHPAETRKKIKELMNELARSAQAKARGIGRTVSQKMFDFLELPWYEFGRKFGYVAGMILFEVILAVATSAIGNLLKEAASLIGRGVALVAKQAMRVLRLVIEGVESLGRMLRGAGSKIVDAFGELAGSIRRLVEEVRALMSKALGGLELAQAEPAGAPSRALISEGRSGLKMIGKRTTPTTVEELMGRPSAALRKEVPPKRTGKKLWPVEEERGAQLPSAKEVKREPSSGETLGELEATVDPRHAGGRPESRAIAEWAEREAVEKWSTQVQRQGYHVYPKGEFHRSDVLKKTFPDKRWRPDAVALNEKRKQAIVMDATGSAGSRTTSRFPGTDRPHVDKTIEDAEQLARQLPEDWTVWIQEVWWRSGGQSRLRRIR